MNQLSRVPFPIKLYFNETFLSNATAFFYVINGKRFFITNWHVVTGKNALTKKCLINSGGCPNQIEWPYGSNYRIPLYENLDINHGKPLWYHHPTHENLIDVVAIPTDNIKVPSSLFNTPIPEELEYTDVIPSVGMDIFVLGFPNGIQANGLPIWKRGTIASEPMVNIDNLPMFYVDSATRSGMSGSPVLLVTNGGYADSQGRQWLASNTKYKFLGVYSGRAPSDIAETKKEDELFWAQLGRVYKASVLKDIIASVVN